MIKYFNSDAFDGYTHVRVSLEYSIGGYNVLFKKNEERGLYLSIVPVDHSPGYCDNFDRCHMRRYFLVRTNKAHAGTIKKTERCLNPVLDKIVSVFEHEHIENLDDKIGMILASVL